MKIAFDCMGTLMGPSKAKVVALYKALQNRGHDMYVWSSEYSLARNLNENLKLNGKVEEKFSKNQAIASGEELMDIAVDDDATQTWLGAKYIVLVRDIPNDIEAFADKLISIRSDAK